MVRTLLTKQKLFAFLFAFLSAVSLVACGGEASHGEVTAHPAGMSRQSGGSIIASSENYSSSMSVVSSSYAGRAESENFEMADTILQINYVLFDIR